MDSNALATPRTPSVVAARKLSQRKHRDSEKKFLVEGPQAIREAVRRPAGGLERLFLTQAAANCYPDLVDEARLSGTVLTTVTEAAIGSLAETVTPQGLVGVQAFLDTSLDSLVLSECALVVVAVAMSDPGNAGTLLRLADAAGAQAVIFADDSVDPYNGKCVRASVGSLFHLSVVRRATSAAVLDAAREAGLATLATTGYGDVDVFDLAEEGELSRPTMWLFGSEAHGLPEPVARLAGRRVAIPIYGKAESLNLATAAAVCLYSSARAQRR